MICDIGVNLLSDFICSIIVAIIGWLVYLLTRRLPLLKFFGISKSKKLTIYLSSLKITSGGATGVDGNVFSYEGLAVPYMESLVAGQLQNIFKFDLPSKTDKNGFLSKLFVADIDVKIMASPSDEILIEHGATMIAIGSPTYNKISENIEKSWKLFAKFDYCPTIITAAPYDTSASGNKFEQIPPSGIILSSLFTPEKTTPSAQQTISVAGQSYKDPSYGFVQRIFDNENKRNIFYVAGLSEKSTTGSVYYLADNWRKLLRDHGNDKNFLILLKISHNDYKNSTVIIPPS